MRMSEHTRTADAHESVPEPDTETLEEDHQSSSRIGPFVVGGAMVIIGLVLLWQVFEIHADGFSMQGPRFFPLIAVVLWLVLSVIYLVQHGMRFARDRGGLPAERFEHTGTLAVLVVLLIGYVYALQPVGYVISTAVLFVACARTLGSRKLWRDIAIGVCLSVVVYVAFTRALNVHLPEGVLGL